MVWVAIVLSILFPFGIGVAQAGDMLVPVRAGGKTSLSILSSGHGLAAAIIETHEVDIGKPNDPAPDKPTTSCTYSRYPCSLVDWIDFSVDGKAVFTARSVFADLSDINTASLSAVGSDFVLKLRCGDASEAYEVAIKFNDAQVLERMITLPGSAHIMQETKYFEMPSLN